MKGQTPTVSPGGSGGEDARTAEAAVVHAPRQRLHIRVAAMHADTDFLRELKQVLARHRGDASVLLHLADDESETNLSLPHMFAVTTSEALRQELEAFLGEATVWTETL
jgi:hypothetical protein